MQEIVVIASIALIIGLIVYLVGRKGHEDGQILFGLFLIISGMAALVVTFTVWFIGLGGSKVDGGQIMALVFAGITVVIIATLTAYFITSDYDDFWEAIGRSSLYVTVFVGILSIIFITPVGLVILGALAIFFVIFSIAGKEVIDAVRISSILIVSLTTVFFITMGFFYEPPKGDKEKVNKTTNISSSDDKKQASFCVTFNSRITCKYKDLKLTKFERSSGKVCGRTEPGYYEFGTWFPDDSEVLNDVLYFKQVSIRFSDGSWFFPDYAWLSCWLQVQRCIEYPISIRGSHYKIETSGYCSPPAPGGGEWW